MEGVSVCVRGPETTLIKDLIAVFILGIGIVDCKFSYNCEYILKENEMFFWHGLYVLIWKGYVHTEHFRIACLCG